MRWLGAAFVGGLCAVVCLLLMAVVLRAQPGRFAVTNFRGTRIPAVGGIAVFGGSLAWLAVKVAAYYRGDPLPGQTGSTPFSAIYLGILLVTAGFFFLGLIDDLGTSAQARGFSGHLRALLSGRVTSGLIKAFGGLAVAGIAAWVWEQSLGAAAVSAMLIALAANLINLLDLRPGRAVKGFFLAWFPVALIGGDPYVLASAAVAGPAAVWLPFDLREKAMLGDAGSNQLGAVVGAGLALGLSDLGRLIALAVLILANLASEKWSFSKLIDSIPGIRLIDRLGRRRPYQPS